MPTGYTAAIEDGTITEFKDFVMRCARGMGACVMVRDEPFDAPLPERFEPSTSYYDQAIRAATKLLSELECLSDSAADARAEQEYMDAVTAYEARLSQKAKTELRYERMLSEVNAWEPPTDDHVGLKEFMIRQINESTKYSYTPDKPTAETGSEWLARTRKKALGDLKYSKVNRMGEIERTENRNKWLADLRASLVN